MNDASVLPVPRLVRSLNAIATVAYLLALFVLWLSFRHVGESWWVTGIGLYLPRFPLVLPLPVLVALTVLYGPRWCVLPQVAAALIWLFPLMGFVLPSTAEPVTGERIRLVSCNVSGGHAGYSRQVAHALAERPDILLFQELYLDRSPLFEAVDDQLPYVATWGQFFLATRFPVLSISTSKPVAVNDETEPANYVRYVLDTPLGLLALYNVHPVSPRKAFYALRGESGLKNELLTGEILEGKAAAKMRELSNVRQAQLAAAAASARRETHPVVLAGDFNLPVLSPIWHQVLSDFKDGFVQVGAGFGNTFPHREGWPIWLRLDRVLSSDEIRFVRFEVLAETPSDHLCVLAEITPQGPPP